MLKRLWPDYRNSCLLTLVLLLIGIVASPWFLVAAVLPIGLVLRKEKPIADKKTIEEEDKTIIETPVQQSEGTTNTQAKREELIA
tara:strand:+ start:102 stop:356 length:255 start_codon:yes stop_codon:yes gene_type:complete